MLIKRFFGHRVLNTAMPSGEIQQQKQQLRKTIQTILNNLDSENIAHQSSIITARALSLPEYKHAETLSIFLSMPGKEMSTNDIVRQAFKDGKKVYVPYIHRSKADPKLRMMDMLLLRDEHDLDSLKPDAWGIPSLSKESIGERENALGGMGCLEDINPDSQNFAKLDLIFMPSMAFDTLRNRLGHGKGFYDRYISLYQSLSSPDREARPKPHLIGLALKEQILSPGQEIPTNELDWKVDQVITSED